MFQTKKIFIAALIFVSAAVCFVAAARAQKKTIPLIPGGSYQQSCSKIKIVNATTLQAYCLTKSEGADPSFWDKLTGAGKEFTAAHDDSKLENYFLCVGDIGNDDGNLTCAKSDKSPQMKAAMMSIDAGLKDVLGVVKTAGMPEYYIWIGRMFENGYAASFYKGWTPMDTVLYMRSYLAQPKESSLRMVIINRALKDATGLDASPEQQAFWDAKIKSGTTGFANIAAAETDKLNANQILRKLMILRTYKDAMGRPPTDAEYNFWTPHKENYSQMIAAHRNWLYSPQGAKDLSATVKEALYAQGVKSPSDADIKAAMAKYAADRKIFEEM